MDSDILFLRAEIQALREELGDLFALLPVPETMTTQDIAKRRGCSHGWLRNLDHPYRLPNFGKADEGGGVKRWRRETVRAWYASPTWEADHRAEWEALSFKERRAYLGVSE